MAGYIRETARKYGIDPEVALKVAKSEGLSTFQSSVTQKSGKREPSWGAFQLYTGGGLGNQFQKDTGLDPSDPANEKATIDYALKTAARVGWGPWHGAKNTGIKQWEGIGGDAATARGASDKMATGTEPAATDTTIKGTDTSTVAPQVAQGPAAAAPADDILSKLKDPRGGASEGLSEAISGLGAALTGASPSGRGNMYATAPAASTTVPIPITPTPAMVPLVDPRAAEAQRQQLAMAMQRLNSGRLY